MILFLFARRYSKLLICSLFWSVKGDKPDKRKKQAQQQQQQQQQTVPAGYARHAAALTGAQFAAAEVLAVTLYLAAHEKGSNHFHFITKSLYLSTFRIYPNASRIVAATIVWCDRSCPGRLVNRSSPSKRNITLFGNNFWKKKKSVIILPIHTVVYSYSLLQILVSLFNIGFFN